MARPVTLFTAQFSDMPFDDLCRLAEKCGYDGLELATFGGYLDIEKAAPLKIQAKGWIQGKWVVLAEKSFPAATHQELVFQAQTMEKILITVSTTEKGGNFLCFLEQTG